MKRLTGVRLRTLGKQLKRARVKLSEVLRFLSATKSKSEVGRAWQCVRDTRKRVWRDEHPRIQRKIQHLAKRSENYAHHRVCRELDQLWEERHNRSKEAYKRLSDDLLGPSTQPPVLGVEKSNLKKQDPVKVVEEKLLDPGEWCNPAPS